MAKVSIILEDRNSHQTKGGKNRLYLRVSYKGHIGHINLHKQLYEHQFDPKTHEVTGFIGAKAYSKRLRR